MLLTQQSTVTACHVYEICCEFFIFQRNDASTTDLVKILLLFIGLWRQLNERAQPPCQCFLPQTSEMEDNHTYFIRSMVSHPHLDPATIKFA